MSSRLSKRSIEKINAIINSYGLTEEDFNNRAKMDEVCVRFEADLIRIGLSPDCFLPDCLKKRIGD